MFHPCGWCFCNCQCHVLPAMFHPCGWSFYNCQCHVLPAMFHPCGWSFYNCQCHVLPAMFHPCGWCFHKYVLFMHFKNLNDVHNILTWLLAKCWCGVKGLRLSVSPLPSPHGTRTILEVLNLNFDSDVFHICFMRSCTLQALLSWWNGSIEHVYYQTFLVVDHPDCKVLCVYTPLPTPHPQLPMWCI